MGKVLCVSQIIFIAEVRIIKTILIIGMIIYYFLSDCYVHCARFFTFELSQFVITIDLEVGFDLIYIY